MHSLKVLVRQGASWTALAAHAYQGEQDLQELLFSAPGILSATQFGGPEFLVPAREFGLPGSGSTDLVAVAADGSILIAECKLAKNDEIKRKVIGQIFEYASYLWKKPFAEFDATFQKIRGESLTDLMRMRVDEIAANDETPEWDEGLFRERVQEHLDSGDFVLAIVVDAMNEELSRTIAYLNEKGRGNNFILYALELLKFKDEHTEVMVPQLHGASVQVLADKKRVADTPRGQAYGAFFKAVLDEFKAKRPGLTAAAVGGSGNAQSWFGFMAGYLNCSFNWSFAQGNRLRVELYMDGPSSESVKLIYDKLATRMGEITAAMGFELEWERLSGKRASRIATYRQGNVFEQPELFEELRAWSVHTMLTFVDVLRPELLQLKHTQS